MILSPICPDEAEPLAVASGDEPSAELRQHLADCPHCPERLERLRDELVLLRQGAADARESASTACIRKPDISQRNGRSDHDFSGSGRKGREIRRSPLVRRRDGCLLTLGTTFRAAGTVVAGTCLMQLMLVS